MGLIVTVSNRIQLLLKTAKTCFWGFMGRIARVQRKTPACHG